MEKTKVAFFEIEPWEKDYLQSKMEGFDLTFFEEKINPNNLDKISDVNVISPFLYSAIDKKVVDSLKSLKYIATRSTGFDHIDLKSCSKNNILVSNVPTYGSNTVAEYTFALILALSRKIYPSVEKTKTGDFSLDGLMGIDLNGKTLGVVGTGNIGKQVIKIAKGFGMKVLAYDIKKEQKLAAKSGFKYVTMENLLKNSDIVTLHLPYNESTHHFINKESLKLFKKGCYLINTSRGGICDTTALLQGLENKIFAGLGLDVLEEEHSIKEERELLSTDFRRIHDLKIILQNNILINQPNVIITPHNAFNSKEALIRILDTTIKNIKSFSKNKLINSVKNDDTI